MQREVFKRQNRDSSQYGVGCVPAWALISQRAGITCRRKTSTYLAPYSLPGTDHAVLDTSTKGNSRSTQIFA